MTQTANAIFNLREIEEYSRGDTFLHRRHPVVHLIICIFFIAVLVSFEKYSLSALIPYSLYPLTIFYITNIPMKKILIKGLPALPLIVGIGIFNPIFDEHIFTFNGISLSFGWISFLSLLLRCILCVSATLLMICVTGFNGISQALQTLRMPKIIIIQFVLTFRYIQLLIEEAGRISLAYALRAPRRKAPTIKEWGILAGQWLLRTLKRADIIYQAMLCRGYSGSFPCTRKFKFSVFDFIFIVLCCSLFLLLRFINLPQVIGLYFV